MVHLSQVSKIYPGRKNPALDNVSLHIKPGEFIFLSGPSGAGKTTLLRLLFGAEYPSSGQVLLAKTDLGRLSKGDLPMLRRRIGVIFQDFRLLPQRTSFENVALALEVAGFKGKDLAKRVRAVLSLVGLLEQARSPVKLLSGGEKQRVAIARALVGGPRIIMADEPTGNLDPQNALNIMRLLVKAHAGGATVLVATHDPALLRLVKGARVLHLEQGKVSPPR